MNAPALAELFELVITAVMRKLRVAGPASVLAYDRTMQKLTVQPLIHEGYTDDDGLRQTRRPAAITNVPVVFLATSDGFRQTIPLAVGDVVVLIHADRSLDRFLVRGGEVDPEDDRAHAPSDVIAIPTMRDFAHAISGVGVNPEIGYPNALIEFTSTQIRAGGTAQIALKSDVDDLRDWVADQFHPVSGHTHAGLGTPPVLGLGGAPYSGDPDDPVGTDTLRGG